MMFHARTQIGGLLHEDHLCTLQALQNLEEFLATHSEKKAPAIDKPEVRAVLEQVIAAIAAEVNRHFSFEETHLFPVLTMKGEGGIAAFLTEEHAAILPLATEMAAAAKAALAGAGFSPAEWSSFHENGVELCEREMLHIQKEEMGLLAAISMLVDKDTDTQLAALYKAHT